MEFSCEMLGITQDQMRDMVIEKMADKALEEVGLDEEGNAYKHMNKAVLNAVYKRVDVMVHEAVTKILSETTEKGIEEWVAGLGFLRTNNYGEPKGEPLTFREWLEKKVSAWFNEKVDANGSTSGYGSKDTNRLSLIIHKHIHYHVQTCVERVIKDGNAVIAGGIEANVKQALSDIAAKMKVTVTTK